MPSASPALQGGYARIPDAFLNAKVSPLARLLLCHLCHFANERGESWYSYEQLGEILGRSKPSICNYVRELRAAGLIACIQQRTHQGFNYRLRIRIVDWQAITERWTRLSKKRSTASVKTEPVAAEGEKIERRVQRAECKDPSGQNKIQENYSARADARPVWTSSEELAWKRARSHDRDPVYQFDRPDHALLKRAIAHREALMAYAGVLSAQEAESLAKAAVAEFCRSRRIAAEPQALAEAARAVASGIVSSRTTEARMKCLAAAWKPHWRRLSTAEQIQALLSEAEVPAPLPADLAAEFGVFQLRATAAELYLRRYDATARVS